MLASNVELEVRLSYLQKFEVYKGLALEVAHISKHYNEYHLELYLTVQASWVINMNCHDKLTVLL